MRRSVGFFDILCENQHRSIHPLNRLINIVGRFFSTSFDHPFPTHHWSTTYAVRIGFRGWLYGGDFWTVGLRVHNVRDIPRDWSGSTMTLIGTSLPVRIFFGIFHPTFSKDFPAPNFLKWIVVCLNATSCVDWDGIRYVEILNLYGCYRSIEKIW